MKKLYEKNKAAFIIVAAVLFVLLVIAIVLLVKWWREKHIAALEERLPLLYIDKLPKNEQKEFEQGVRTIASDLQTDPNELMMVMNLESGLNPKATNPNTTATGLIQFMPDTALHGLGVTTDALRGMTATEQLPYVYQYLKPYAGKMKSFKDTYLAVFYPAALGKNSKFALPKWVTPWNATFDLNKDGEITIGEFQQWLMNKIQDKAPKQYHKFFRK